MTANIKNLRFTIEQLLIDSLGIYSLSNGIETPAIAARAESERLAPGTKVKGLECIVSRYPEQDPVLQYYDQPSRQAWTVWLVGWDSSADVVSAAQTLLQAYPGAEFSQINVPKSWGPTNQVQVIIREPWTVSADAAEGKEIDGGWFHPVLQLPATEAYFVLDGGSFGDGSTQNDWLTPVDGGVFA